MNSTIGIIRGRNQITIPDAIRKVAPWVTPMAVISFSLVRPDEIIITPHETHVDRKTLWKLIKTSRAIKGRGTMSTSDFIALDRQSH